MKQVFINNFIVTNKQILDAGFWMLDKKIFFDLSGIKYPASLSHETLQKVLHQLVGLR
jgi:hypothetical protein